LVFAPYRALAFSRVLALKPDSGLPGHHRGAGAIAGLREVGGVVDAGRVDRFSGQVRGQLGGERDAEDAQRSGKVGTGLWLGANRRTPAAAYASPMSRKAAEVYAAGEDVRFGAKDAMPAAMSQAFLKSIMDYVKSPDRLDAILTGLERTRRASYR
jgi:hypothetical protein